MIRSLMVNIGQLSRQWGPASLNWWTLKKIEPEKQTEGACLISSPSRQYKVFWKLFLGKIYWNMNFNMYFPLKELVLLAVLVAVTHSAVNVGKTFYPLIGYFN